MDSGKEERAQEWTHMDVVSSWKSNQERAKRKGQSSEETGTGKLATYWEEHPWRSSSRLSNRNPTENPPFAPGALPTPCPATPQVRWDGPPVSAQLDTGNVYFVLIFPSCSTSLPAGTEATPLLSAGMQPRDPGAQALRALRRQSSRQGRVGSPTLTDLRGLTQKQLCCEHSDWRPKLKWSTMAP